MADQNIGTARIDIEVDTTKWDAAIASGKTQLKGMSQAAQKEYDSLNGREKRRVGNLLKQADTLGKTRAEQILYNAALRGVPTHILDELKTKLEANERATLANNKAMHSGSKAFSGSSKTASELQFAMRGLPAQFTDIATSLQGGQRPLTVLLQQGGQLKDMFGGIRPALSAVVSQLVKLVNPYTLAAGAAGLLAVAWQKGQNEAAAYNKALILTGGYAGQTADQLQGVAQELDRISGVTEGKAAAAIATVTRSGRFTGEEIRNVTRAALEMQDATGRAIDETVSEFEKLKKKPAEAIVELNDKYHFLTSTIYEQIRALQDQGREREAQKLAVKTYSDEVNRRTREIRENLGLLERGWNSVGSAAKEAWDGMLNVGREKTLQDRIDETRRALAEAQNNLSNPIQGSVTIRGTLSPELRKERVTQLRRQLGEMLEQQQQNAFAQGIETNRRRANDISIAFQQRADTFKSEAEKLAQQIKAVDAKERAGIAAALASGDKELAETIRRNAETVKKGLRDQLKTTASHATNADRLAKVYDKSREALAKYTKAQIEDEQKDIDARNRAQASIDAYAASLQDMLATRQQEINFEVASASMGDIEARQRAYMLSIQRDYVRRRDQLKRREKLAQTDGEKAHFAEQLRLLEEYFVHRKAMEERGFAREQVVRASAMDGALRAMKNFVDAANDTAGQTQQVFGDVLDGLTNEFAAFFAGEKANWKDFARDILKYVEKIMIAKAIAGIAGGISDGLSFGEGSAYLAKGGVYDSPSLSKYSGGIYDTPQVFTFAKGTGIFGEAGPEAIMPLKRGPDGSLGVRAQGGIQGGITVQNYVTVNADGDTQSSSRGDQSTTGRKIGKMFEAQTVKVVTRMTRPGGLLWREYGVGK